MLQDALRETTEKLQQTESNRDAAQAQVAALKMEIESLRQKTNQGFEIGGFFPSNKEPANSEAGKGTADANTDTLQEGAERQRGVAMMGSDAAGGEPKEQSQTNATDEETPDLMKSVMSKIRFW